MKWQVNSSHWCSITLIGAERTKPSQHLKQSKNLMLAKILLNGPFLYITQTTDSGPRAKCMWLT